MLGCEPVLGENNSPSVSVIICTFNGRKRLRTTLLRICGQTLPQEGTIEVILVDNRSTDGTAEFAQELWREVKPQSELRIVKEPVQGRTKAMLTGFAHAKAECLVMCDDDNWLGDNYCRKAHEILGLYPDVAVAGGSSIAAPEITPPEWFEKIALGWAVGTCKATGYKTGPDPCVWGAGMVVRKSAVKQLIDSGFNFICTARAGSSLNSGEDSELCRALRMLGWRLFEDEGLKLQHQIEKHRLTADYALRLWSGFGAGDIAVDADRLANSANSSFRTWVSLWWPYQTIRAALWLLVHVKECPIFHVSDPTPALRWCRVKGRMIAIWGLKRQYGLLIRQKIRWVRKVCAPKGSVSCKMVE